MSNQFYTVIFQIYVQGFWWFNAKSWEWVSITNYNYYTSLLTIHSPICISSNSEEQWTYASSESMVRFDPFESLKLHSNIFPSEELFLNLTEPWISSKSFSRVSVHCSTPANWTKLALLTTTFINCSLFFNSVFLSNEVAKR